MEKGSLTKTLWNAYTSDDVETKQAAIETALREVAGDDGFAAMCSIQDNGEDVETALEATEEQPNEERVAALIRQATS